MAITDPKGCDHWFFDNCTTNNNNITGMSLGQTTGTGWTNCTTSGDKFYGNTFYVGGDKVNDEQFWFSTLDEAMKHSLNRGDTIQVKGAKKSDDDLKDAVKALMEAGERVTATRDKDLDSSPDREDLSQWAIRDLATAALKDLGGDLSYDSVAKAKKHLKKIIETYNY